MSLLQEMTGDCGVSIYHGCLTTHVSSVVGQPWYILTRPTVTRHLLKKTHPKVEILRLSLVKPLDCLIEIEIVFCVVQ